MIYHKNLKRFQKRELLKKTIKSSLDPNQFCDPMLFEIVNSNII